MKQQLFSKFLIAATSSGCGKTTLSLGLMRALSRKGLRVQPFKCGPDYIDTQFHFEAAGLRSINLDLFMSSPAHVEEIFNRYSYDKDVSIVEGVMGLFDGYNRYSGSSADIAELLHLPVILIVDASSTAYSVAATIYGFTHFNPRLKISGVIFNRVGSASHASFLREACIDAKAECLGTIPRIQGLQTPSRHLGLTLKAKDEMNEFIDMAADIVENNVDIMRLIELCRCDTPSQISEETLPEISHKATVAVAYDEAFNFIYPENLRALSTHLNADIKFFSPLTDTDLPANTSLLYLPGGYPELYAKQLEANKSMRESVKEYVESGGFTIGECGGMIYLGQDLDGHEMCGCLPIHTTMSGARLRLGYRHVDFGTFSIRGHEFHYSRVTNPDILPSVASQKNVRGESVDTPLYRYKNLFASYTHLYWGECDPMAMWRQ
ncbi:MAG: cobyrinate a,c-diamide synthase [Paramuribaculum sp.]|nr:cobyrinate a,c-diamide synthase [Paramuribaculum sp.]